MPNFFLKFGFFVLVALVLEIGAASLTPNSKKTLIFRL